MLDQNQWPGISNSRRMESTPVRLIRSVGQGGVGIPPLACKQFSLAAGERGEGEDTSGLADSFTGITIVPSQSIGLD